jgi:glutaredoxin
MIRVLIFTQPGCFSCDLMKTYLEAREIVFEERDISANPEFRCLMLERYASGETPTLVVFSGETEEVITGFDPVRLDQLLAPAPSSDAVTQS